MGLHHPVVAFDDVHVMYDIATSKLFYAHPYLGSQKHV